MTRSEYPVTIDIICPECSFTGPAPMSLGDGPRVVTCPECLEEWEIVMREEL